MNGSPQTQTSQFRQPGRLVRPMHQMAVRSAWVAGIFSAIVCLLLLWDFAHRQGTDPLESERFLVLKSLLAQRQGAAGPGVAAQRAELEKLKARALAISPQQLKQQAAKLGSDELKELIRDMDLRLRRRYFRQRWFTQTGAWLLLGGLVVLAAAAKTAATLRRKLPMPGPAGLPVDREAAVARAARWAVASLGVLCLATAVALSLGWPSPLATAPQGRPTAAVGLPPTGSGGPETGGAGGAEAVTTRQKPQRRPTGTPLAQSADNWPRFRGPGGLGISHHSGVPTSWDGDSGQGILWKTPVPLPGNNSPVVWQDRVFLSGATESQRQVYCFDAYSGRLLWQKDVPATPQGSVKTPEVMEETGYAAPTVATDGSRVFAIFANGDLVALDFDGNQVWIRGLGIPRNAYGHASSLVVYRDRLLVQFDQGTRDDDLSKLLAVDVATGKTIWEAPRKVPNSWTTPIVITVGGADQIVTAADPWVIAYQPDTGQEIWRAKCLSQDVGPSPVFADGIVYAGNEYSVLSAIRADGRGDVTETHVLWEGEDGLPDTASPLATDQYVFLLASYGILTCYDAKTGEMLWDREFENTTFTSSPSMVGELLYVFGEIEEEGPSGDFVKRCRAWVLRPTRQGAEEVGGGEFSEGCVTSPAFQPGRLYIRGSKHLFCIGSR